MHKISNVPEATYGVLQQNKVDDVLDEIVEQVRNLGYAVFDAGYTSHELENISYEFNNTQERYIKEYSEPVLKAANEFHTVRSLLTHGGDVFLRLALNDNLLLVLKKLISGKFILNQQNGVINPRQEAYNQGAWHRDLPYQHFVSSKPIAVNALFCVDEFTLENGATFVLPASHKSEGYPSSKYVRKNAVQVEAKAGTFILLDCMLFHSGGFNNSKFSRRAINHVYTIPYFKQQINIPMNLKNVKLSAEEKDILGFNYMEPSSIKDYISARASGR